MALSTLSPDISIVIPCYRSGRCLPQLVQRLKRTLQNAEATFEILLVNDASQDETWPVIQKLAEKYPFVRGFDLLFNTGQFRATICGMEQARGKTVLTMDDDLQHPPEEIPKLWNALQASPDLDCVIGVYDLKQHDIVRRFGTWIFGRLLNRFYRSHHKVKLSSFRIMRDVVAEGICQYRTSRPIIGAILLQLTPRIANVFVKHEERLTGQSGYRFTGLLRTAFDALILGSRLPLRVCSVLGLFLIAAGLVWGGRAPASGLVQSEMLLPTKVFLFLIPLIGGAVLVSLGIVGEYIFHLVREISGTPRYILRGKTDETLVSIQTPLKLSMPLSSLVEGESKKTA